MSAELLEELAKGPEEYEALRPAGGPATLEEWVRQNAPAMLEDAGLSSLPRIVHRIETQHHLRRMFWAVADCKSATHTLFTSDRPLVQLLGLGHPNCVIALPLSPRHAFLAANREAVLTRLVGANVSMFAKQFNENILRQAVDYVYSAEDGHQAYVRKRLIRPA